MEQRIAGGESFTGSAEMDRQIIDSMRGTTQSAAPVDPQLLEGLGPQARQAAMTAAAGGVAGGGQISFPGGGSMMSLDVSGIQGVLSQFQEQYPASLTPLIEPFQGIAANLQQLNDTFANLTMTHKFQGDMSMAFSITNANELKTAIAQEMTETMRQIITEHLQNQGRDFTAGP